MNKKFFHGAILETILLSLINNAESSGLHGYAMFNEIRKKYGIRLGPSLLYSELKLMEQQGLLESNFVLVSGKVRRRYRITQKGKNKLNEYFIQLRIIVPSFMECNAKVQNEA